MAKRKKIDKKLEETQKILQKIEDKEIEAVQYQGRSNAWKKFVKLRNKATNTFIDYVQCKECKVLRLYSRKNGTTTLNNHEYHNENEDDEVFKEISVELASELKTILTQKLMEFCAEDVISVDTVLGPGFIRFVQCIPYLVEKYGKVDFRNIFPNESAINQCIQNVRNKQQLQVTENFHNALSKKWCSLSMNVWQTDVNEKQLLIANASYFNGDLTALIKEALFTVPIQGDKEKFKSEIQIKLESFGCDELKFNSERRNFCESFRVKKQSRKLHGLPH